ncbi:HTH-type transcriptional activator RhaR [bioreactor metagenome]|uniref:HTH-type transcriptional activator RhaR n=1 Tax=bioreactor metagenome TaxID=1076179 RepID=A0A644XMS9_9ZZZZ
MGTCFQKVQAAQGFLQINHCHEGSFELELQGGMVSFLTEGDVAVNAPGVQQITDSRLPTGRYVGVAILLELATAQRSLDTLLPYSGINLFRLSEKLCSGRELFLLRARPEIEHIFSELYHVDDRIRETYIFLKTAELLLFLTLAENELRDALPRFSRQVVEATKAVCAYLMTKPVPKVPICELAGRFNVADTSLRECFKSIYGCPIGAFIRLQRMKRASTLLRDEEELSIGQIAQMVGYENQSKFAAAFKAVMLDSPLSYRHRHTRQDDKTEHKFDVME